MLRFFVRDLDDLILGCVYGFRGSLDVMLGFYGFCFFLDVVLGILWIWDF